MKHVFIALKTESEREKTVHVNTAKKMPENAFFGGLKIDTLINKSELFLYVRLSFKNPAALYIESRNIFCFFNRPYP